MFNFEIPIFIKPMKFVSVPAILRYTAQSISADRLLHERSTFWSIWHPSSLIAA